MDRWTSRTVRSASIAAIILAAQMGVALGAVEPALVAERAATLLEEGRAVESRSILLSLRKNELDANQRERVMQLLSAADRRLETMGRVEISLQKAELAVKQGDLRLADQQANAARKADEATPEQKQRASQLLDESARVRDQLAPMVPAALAQAVQDFDNGRFGEAKAGLGSVSRSGVKLTQSQTATLNRYQNRLLEVEREERKTFDVDYVPMGVISSAAGAGAPALTEVVLAAQPTDSQAEPESAPAGTPPAAEPPPATDRFTEAAKFDAQRLITEADAAFQAGRYAEAAQKYTEAASTYGTYLDAQQTVYVKDRAVEARTRLGGAGGNLLQQVGQQRDLMREEATVVYDNLVGRSKKALEAGDTAEARNLAAQARLNWNNAFANGLFSDEEYRAKAAAIDELLRSIDAAEDQIRRSEIDTRAKSIEAEARDAGSREKSEREKKINENLDRLRALQAEQKYEEALQVTEQILFLDPTNPAALLMKDIIQDVIWYREWERLQRAKTGSWFEESLEVQRGMIATQNVVDYPSDWPEISFRRGEVESFVESDADRRVLATLESRRIPASFQDNSLADVIQFIATVTNLNVDADWDSLVDIGIEKDTQISLQLQEVPARVVLDRVLAKISRDEFSRAGWAVNDGVLVIASQARLNKNKFLVLYDVRDLLYQVPSFTNVPQLDLEQVLSQAGGGGGGGGNPVQSTEAEQEGLTEEELLRRLQDIITNNIDRDGWATNGGDVGTLEELNGQLVITNTARNHREIARLLKQLREVRSIQVSVETRFLSIAQDFFEKIGFDIDVVFNAQNNQFRDAQAQQRAFGAGTLANGNLSTLPSDLIRNDRIGGSPNWRVVDPNADEIQFQIDDPNNFAVTAPESTSIIPVTQGSDLLTNQLILASQFAQEILGPQGLAQPALSVAGTFLDDIQVDFLIEATQADRRNVVLNAPRLTFTNGRAANISVVTQTAFISDLSPVVSQGSVAFDPQVGISNTGFALAVRGVVSADRRYVTLTVQAGLSVPAGPAAQFEVNAAVAGGGGVLGGGGSEQIPGRFSVPVLAVTQVNTGATVPDQGTILLGGQRMNTELEVETGVPVLSKIPIINRFFTNRAMSKEESTLLVLLRPTIIIQNEQEELQFPGLLDKLSNPFR